MKNDINDIKLFNLDPDCYLTTIDNPFNPKEDYDAWNEWDQDNGYFTERYINSIADFDVEEGSLESDSKRQKAILEILKNDPLGIYLLIK